MPGPEASVKTWVRNTLISQLPGIYIANIHQSMYSNKGVPDLLICYNGLFVGLEVKTEKGVVSRLQSLELSKIDEANGISCVIYGKDKDKINKLIDILKRSKNKT